MSGKRKLEHTCGELSKRQKQLIHLGVDDKHFASLLNDKVSSVTLQ